MNTDNLYRNFSRESSSSVTFHLFNRHDRMASIYRQIAEGAAEKNLRTWFGSLAKFRQQLADELRQLIEDSGETPVQPSQEMKPYLESRSDEITNYLNEGNAVGLIDLSLAAEQDVSRYYREAADNKDIPKPIREILEAQHGRLLKVIRKAERLQTVPEDEDEGFEV